MNAGKNLPFFRFHKGVRITMDLTDDLNLKNDRFEAAF